MIKIYLRQIMILTRANLKSRYRNSFSGFLWVILNPLFMFGAQSYAFHLILQLDVKNYAMFLASGLLPWIFMSQTLEMGVGHFVNSARLLKSLPLKPVTLLLALALDNLINLFAAFLVILVPIGLLTDFSFVNLIVFPIPLVILLFGVLSLSWILATLNVIFRDIKFLVPFVMTTAYYLTPIFYPITFVPEKYRWLVEYNIFYFFVSPFREMINDPFNLIFVISCLKALAVSGVLFLVAIIVWRKKRNAVYNYL